MTHLHRVLRSLLLFSLMLGLSLPAPVAAQTVPQPYLSRYALPGNPLDVAVESPQSVWVTLPTANKVAHLTLDGAGQPSVTQYTLPSPSSEPYAISLGGGAVWVTERAGNRIARLDPLSGQWREYTLPTANARPSGLKVAPGSPVRVWFAQNGAGGLGELVYNDANNVTINEYTPPTVGGVAPLLQDVDLDAQGRIWFTAPNVTRIGRFNPAQAGTPSAFALVSTGSGSQPWTIKVDQDGFPWIVDRAQNRLGKYFPTTMTLILWYAIPTAGTAPYDLLIRGGSVWFTQYEGHRLGQLSPAVHIWQQVALGRTAPAGIDGDVNGCIWAAESSAAGLSRLCPPYFQNIYLPLNIQLPPSLPVGYIPISVRGIT